MSTAWRIARRELRGGLKGFRVFLACLALGVAAIAAVGTVRESIRAGLATEGAALLGGDAEVTLTYRRAEAAERTALEAASDALSEVIEFRSMAVVGAGETEDRALTQVKAVDAAYPLVGQVALDPPMPLAEALAGRGGRPGAVMDRLLVDRLALSVGEEFALGGKGFVLMAVLEREPDNASGGFGLGPRTMVASDGLADTGLIAPGSLFDTHYRLSLAEGTNLAAAETRVMATLEGAGARWRDARDGAPGVRVFVERLGSFLVLVGLAGLAVGGVGVSAAVRAFLDGKTATIATLKTLGASARMIFTVYLMQIGVLTALGLGLGLVLGAGLPLAFAPLIEARLPIPAEFTLQWAPLGEAALYGLLAALLFTLWPLAQAEQLRAAALFRDASLGRRRLPRWPWIVVTAALLVALVGLAAWLTGVAVLAFWSAVGILGAFLVLLAAGAGIRLLARWLAGRRALRGRPVLRGALSSVGGPGGEAGSVVLSLGLGLSVLAAVGQIDNNLRGAIDRELPEVAPSFFVVDIQPDQVADVLARVEGDPAISRIDRAPMLRGVITQINGRPASEVAGDHWVVRGDRGLTYAAAKPDRTTVTAGEWWPEDYAGAPQISFAEEEAMEMGLSLGDTMTVNILGRDITGTITSFRAVDFSSAGMGFVMTMNPAALQGAPHTHIMTIYAEQEAEASILRDISRGWPNITVISVRDAIGRVTGLMGQVAAAITYGALASLVTGFVVLIGAAAAGERARTWEAAVLKTLGASRGSVLANFALRSAILGAAAGLVAVFAGGLAGWAVTHFVMEGDFVFEPVSAVAIVTGGVLVTVLAGLAFAWRPLAARPARVLRARE
jgi:putative ABC transport system permease protein